MLRNEYLIRYMCRDSYVIWNIQYIDQLQYEIYIYRADYLNYAMWNAILPSSKPTQRRLIMYKNHERMWLIQSKTSLYLDSAWQFNGNTLRNHCVCVIYQFPSKPQCYTYLLNYPSLCLYNTMKTADIHNFTRCMEPRWRWYTQYSSSEVHAFVVYFGYINSSC